MNKHEQARLKSYRAVDVVLTRFADEVATVPALLRNVATFQTDLAALEAAATEEAAYTPQSETKAVLREALADAAVPVALALAAQADEAGDPSAADRFDLPRSAFLHGTQQAAIGHGRTVLEAAQADPDGLADYGVDAPKTAALAAALEAYVEALPAPRDEVVARSAHVAAIDRLVPAIAELLGRRVDRLMVQFRGTPFGDEYASARRIVDPGARPASGDPPADTDGPGGG